MYSDEDLDSAVKAGILSTESVASFRAFTARSQVSFGADEEHFRLLTGFNDIFVSIAASLILGAVGWLVGSIAHPLGGAAVSVCSWGLAEYFTRRRRMALPSILLLLTFVGGAFQAGFASIDAANGGGRIAVSAALATGAALLHWWRFRVPITVAAGVLAAIVMALALFVGDVPGANNLLWPLLLASGLIVFALGLRWDMSDRNRTTRRSDVAFWLHLAAAPLIVHPTFEMLGVMRGGLLAAPEANLTSAGTVLVIYAGLALIAVVIDRRALLVSGLSYVLYAMTALLRAVGSLSVSLALPALLIGSALLLLSVYWRPARKLVVGLLPSSVRDRLPVA